MSSSGTGVSKRQAKRDDRKARRTAKTDARLQQQLQIRNSLPFTIPHAAEPRLHLVESKYGAKSAQRLPQVEWQAWIDKEMEVIPHTSSITHAAIPNPNYIQGRHIPRYAAVRFARATYQRDEDALLTLVTRLEETKYPFKTTGSHGKNFKQSWEGVWRPYSKAPLIAKGGRPDKAVHQEIVDEIGDTLDAALQPVRQLLRKTDELVYNRTRHVHAESLRAALQSQTTSQMKWLAADPARSNTSSHRFAGLGNMLAVSIATGNGTSFHYDNNDDGHYYSMILVLGKGGFLMLPETGFKLRVERGDVVFFLANQQLHKLDVDDDCENDAKTQTVFTLWTDARTMSVVRPSASHEDFFFM